MKLDNASNKDNARSHHKQGHGFPVFDRRLLQSSQGIEYREDWKPLLVLLLILVLDKYRGIIDIVSTIHPVNVYCTFTIKEEVTRTAWATVQSVK